MTRELRAAAITNHSVIPAVVTQNADEDQLVRVKVRFPWMSSQDESDWLPVAAPGAGAQRGLFFVPEINDLVLVAFAFGRIDRAYVIGSLWNSQDKPPAQERAQRTLGGRLELHDVRASPPQNLCRTRAAPKSADEQVHWLQPKMSVSGAGGLEAVHFQRPPKGPGSGGWR